MVSLSHRSTHISKMMQPFLHSFSMQMSNGKPELMWLLDVNRIKVLGREGSVSPMCGCTLCLGLPYKNSGLRRRSTRQPTVYSYTASHRSPCIRVDSPTQFHLHQHHVHHHPDSHQKYPHCKL